MVHVLIARFHTDNLLPTLRQRKVVTIPEPVSLRKKKDNTKKIERKSIASKYEDSTDFWARMIPIFTTFLVLTFLQYHRLIDISPVSFFYKQPIPVSIIHPVPTTGPIQFTGDLAWKNTKQLASLGGFSSIKPDTPQSIEHMKTYLKEKGWSIYINEYSVPLLQGQRNLNKGSNFIVRNIIADMPATMPEANTKTLLLVTYHATSPKEKRKTPGLASDADVAVLMEFARVVSEHFNTTMNIKLLVCDLSAGIQKNIYSIIDASRLFELKSLGENHVPKDALSLHAALYVASLSEELLKNIHAGSPLPVVSFNAIGHTILLEESCWTQHPHLTMGYYRAGWNGGNTHFPYNVSAGITVDHGAHGPFLIKGIPTLAILEGSNNIVLANPASIHVRTLYILKNYSTPGYISYPPGFHETALSRININVPGQLVLSIERLVMSTAFLFLSMTHVEAIPEVELPNPTTHLKSICIIGFGAGDILGWAQKHISNVVIHGVDIEPAALTITRDYFGVVINNTNTKTWTQNGMEYINKTLPDHINNEAMGTWKDKYDLIIIDAFTSSLLDTSGGIFQWGFNPTHLSNLKDRLTEKGIIVIDLSGFSSYPNEIPNIFAAFGLAVPRAYMVTAKTHPKYSNIETAFVGTWYVPEERNTLSNIGAIKHQGERLEEYAVKYYPELSFIAAAKHVDLFKPNLMSQ